MSGPIVHLRTSMFPGRYVQGASALETLETELARFGTRFACLIDPAISEQIETRLASLVSFSCASRVSISQCTNAAIDSCAEWARRTQAQALIGCGGGKVIDTARAAADLLGIAFICIPTVAASDAPCSALAVIYDEQGRVVEDRFVRRNPALVLVDTALLMRAPVRFFISGVGDALATWYEAEACRQSGAQNLCGGVATQLAHEAARLCRDTLFSHARQAVRDCREQTASAALEATVEATVLLSGLGFESGGVAAAHAIHHGLSELEQCHGALHGEKVAIGVLASLFLSTRPDAERLEVFTFCRDVGLPTRLADIGLPCANASQLEEAARRACRAGEIIHNEPYPVSWPQVVEALQAMEAFSRTHLPA